MRWFALVIGLMLSAQVVKAQDSATDLVMAGKAAGNNGDYATAVEDYTKALEISPDLEKALSGRTYALYKTDRFEESLVDSTRLVGIDPEYYWYPYMRGLALTRLERFDAARVALDTSLGLKPDYFYALAARATVSRATDQNAEAIADLQHAVLLRPFEAFVYSRLGDILFEQQKTQQAAGYYRAANILDPNAARPIYRLEGLAPPVSALTMEPMAFIPPETGLTLRYLQVILPKSAATDGMEDSIADLIDWFRPSHKAMPEAKVLFSRSIGETRSDQVTLNLNVDAKDIPDGALDPSKTPDSVTTYRGLMPTEMQPSGPNGPKMAIRFDDGDLASLWPLKEGNTVSGTGRYVLVCPDKFILTAAALGCRGGVETVDVGHLEYNLTVEPPESIQVPMGRFDTQVVRYREISYIELFGKRQDHTLETKWWIAPELDFWVKRTSQQGDKMYLVEAMERL